jgi:predicted GNAT family N-acyltransferase
VTPAASIDVHWVSRREELDGAITVREKVFCEEQGVSPEEELDGRDGDARHIVAVVGDRGPVIATTRLLTSAGVAKIGRVAVERDWRRHGIASRMLALALDGAREGGCTRARLAAQVQATELYRQAGFSVESEPFEEAGITHVWMGRSLTAPG